MVFLKTGERCETQFCYILRNDKTNKESTKHYVWASNEDIDYAFSMVKSYNGTGTNGHLKLKVIFWDINDAEVKIIKDNKNSLEIYADTEEDVKKCFYERLLNQKIP